jgi:secreted trypsin-like serine protease
LLSLSCAAAAVAQEEIKPFNRRIVGGEKTDIKQHPWQVALNVKIGDKTYLCGGSIIAQRWVLTAAHCFAPSTGSKDVRVKSGVTDHAAAGTWLGIERIVLHDGYKSGSPEHDIALIKLTSPPTPPGRVIPLAPAAMEIPIHQPLEVTGWGDTKEDGSPSTVLLKASVPYTNPTVCNDASAHAGEVTAGMLCAGHQDGGVDACQGDSGGPLVWHTSDGPILVGVVSWGDGCARKLKYGVYTRVSAYRDWIDRVVAADRP